MGARARLPRRESFALPPTSSVDRLPLAERPSLPAPLGQWHALAEPDLYRSITLSHPLSYALLAAQLADPTRRPPLQKWIRRAVLRSVPPGWSAAGSAVGGVLGGLRELESLKVRFGEGKGRRAGGAGAQGPEGEGGQAADDDDGAAAGAAAAGEGEERAPVGVEPSVWAAFPNLNPRMSVLPSSPRSLLLSRR